MSILYIHPHLGLGDQLDCNGLVRFLLDMSEYDKIGLFCKDKYYDLVSYMYRDNDCIQVIGVSDRDEYLDVNRIYQNDYSDNKNFLRIGHEHYVEDSQKNCWEIFYEQVKVPYSVRYDYFYCEDNAKGEMELYKKLNPNDEPYVFLHDVPSRGYTIDRNNFLDSELLVIENDPSENIFHYSKILKKAKEIHCIESSFKTLVDFYCDEDQKNIFYHNMRGHPLGNMSRDFWQVIDYDEIAPLDEEYNYDNRR